ncbi:hypothetical protein [Nostoc sp.]|uniref:hypothetical protein n=1 Tax=Nostoc sp. TaxID=1180 RepID=UPI002FF92A74
MKAIEVTGRIDPQGNLGAITTRKYCRRSRWGIGEDYIIYKVRVRNSSIQKGKRAGYRLIYQLESPTSILLLTIYSKSDREDIGANEILNIVADFFSQSG